MLSSIFTLFPEHGNASNSSSVAFLRRSGCFQSYKVHLGMPASLEVWAVATIECWKGRLKHWAWVGSDNQVIKIWALYPQCHTGPYLPVLLLPCFIFEAPLHQFLLPIFTSPSQSLYGSSEKWHLTICFDIKYKDSWHGSIFKGIGKVWRWP